MGIHNREYKGIQFTISTDEKRGLWYWSYTLGAEFHELRERPLSSEGIAIGEDGKITFPKDKVEKIANVNLLPRTIGEIEKDGGWEFVTVTADDHYLFRRAK